MLEEIVPIWYHHGFFAAICAQSSWTPRMEQFYILNYMFKVGAWFHFSPRLAASAD